MDIAKLVFVCTSTLLVLGSTFSVGLYSGVTQNAAFTMVRDGANALSDALAAIAETAILVPEPFLQPARRPGEGVTLNRRGEDGALILMAGFFEGDNQLRLVRRDGSVVARWPVRFSELFPEPDHVAKPPATDWNIDTHGALALPNGSVVFNFEYGGLVKLDRCGRVAWTLAEMTHHSVEPAAGGGYWVPGRRAVVEGPSEFPPFKVPFYEDFILRVSEDGRVLGRISVPRLLYDNGLETLLTANGVAFDDIVHDPEIVHLNKIAELTADRADAFPQFEAGDLALSIRQYNLLVVFAPESLRLKWWQVGPWRRQHDPEFDTDGTIVLFNNNVYLGQELAPADRSNILRLDPASRRVETLFGDRPGQEFLTVLRGRVDLLEGGGLLITEFEGGRVIETDAAGETVWEYVNLYDAENVAEISEARLYPAGYFGVEDWTCPGA